MKEDLPIRLCTVGR